MRKVHTMEQLYKIPYLPGTFFNRQLNKRKSSPHWLVSQQTVRVTLALAQVFAEARLLQQNFHIWLVVLCALSTFLTLSTLLNLDSLDLPLLLIEKRPYDMPNFEGYFVNTHFECLS